MVVKNRVLATLLLSCGLTGTAMGTTSLVDQPAFTLAPAGQQSDASTGAYEQVFAFPADSWVEVIRWWGFHGTDSGGAAFDNFRVHLGGVLQTGVLHSTAVFDSSDVYLYSMYTLDIADGPLTGSSLRVQNDSEDVAWFWQSATAVGNAAAPSDTLVAYSLLGRAVSPVPETGTGLLLAAGLAALLLGRRRQQPAGVARG